jgi:hypothetical protein
MLTLLLVSRGNPIAIKKQTRNTEASATKTAYGTLHPGIIANPTPATTPKKRTATRMSINTPLKSRILHYEHFLKNSRISVTRLQRIDLNSCSYSCFFILLMIGIASASMS